MKSIAILFLSFIVFAAFTNSVHCTLEDPNPPEQVRDTRGKLVRVNTQYYIVPINAESGGGVTLGNTTHKTCPVGIFQEDDDDNTGLPITFYPVNPKKGVIRISTDLNIEFSSVDRCDNSNVWKVDKRDKHSKKFYISIDGVKGNPGSETISNWFKIEKFESGYKLMHCPSVEGDEEGEECKNVGLVKYKGQKRLALSNDPFGVKFKRA